jgi:hypothetical protein
MELILLGNKCRKLLVIGRIHKLKRKNIHNLYQKQKNKPLRPAVNVSKHLWIGVIYSTINLGTRISTFRTSSFSGQTANWIQVRRHVHRKGIEKDKYSTADWKTQSSRWSFCFTFGKTHVQTSGRKPALLRDCSWLSSVPQTNSERASRIRDTTSCTYFPFRRSL